MRVFLFDPPYERLMGIKTTLAYPIGLSYLAATLKRAGHEAVYINLDYDEDLTFVNPFSRLANINNYRRYTQQVSDDCNSVWNSLRQFILKYSPQIIGISCTTIKMRSALMMAKVVKEANSDIKVVIGGHHPMLYPEQILHGSPYIDVIAFGEFDLGLVDVVNAIQNNIGSLHEKLYGISGICVKDNHNRVIKTENRELIKSLDDLPFPESAYYLNDSKLKILPLTSMIASRGCPYKCAYCGTTNIWGRNVRFRSPHNVLNEIKYRFRTQNCRAFSFFDDCFTLNKNWIMEFCDRIIKDKVAINWSCISSINLIDENIFRKIVEAGCVKINLGVETGSKRIAKLLNRTVPMEQIRMVFKYAKKYRIATSAYFMLGFPTETIQDVFDTQKFICELSPNWVYANVLIPLPGTEMFRMCVQMDLIDEKMAWSGQLYKDLQTNYTGTIDDNTFNELVDETFALCFKINRKASNLFRRIPIKQYIANPLRIIADSRRVISWVKNR